MIEPYGWTEELQRDFQAHAAAGLVPARVIAQQRGLLGLMTPSGEARAEAAGALLFAAGPGELPVAGDWVAAEPPPGEGNWRIRHVLHRRTAFARKAAGRTALPQVVAANIDIAFLVMALGADLNPRRLERYLAAAWQSGARPVVLLTKADLAPEPLAEAAGLEAGGDRPACASGA